MPLVFAAWALLAFEGYRDDAVFAWIEGYFTRLVF